jgi:hypothetical protein
MEKAEFKAEIARLAGIEYVDYCRESKAAAKQLGITKRELDRCVKDAERKALTNKARNRKSTSLPGSSWRSGLTWRLPDYASTTCSPMMADMFFRKAHSIIGQVASGLN